MARMQVWFPVRDLAGNQLANAPVYFFAVGTTDSPLTNPPTGDAISGAIYTTRTGGGTTTSPVESNSSGFVQVWLENAQALDLVVCWDSGVRFAGTDQATQQFTPQVFTYDTSGDVEAHEADPTGAHAASAISATPFESIAGTTVQAQLEEIFDEASGAPSGPAGGELAGTYPDPTVDALHSGSTHADTQSAAEATAAAALSTHDADTTAVHGIADTSALATSAALTTHEADTTSVHGFTDTSQAALKNAANVFTRGQTITGSADEVQLSVTAHSTQTTSVMGVQHNDGVGLLSVTSASGFGVVAMGGSTGALFFGASSYGNNSTGSQFSFNKFRGSNATPGDVANNDQMMTLGAFGYFDGTSRQAARIRALVDAVPSGTTVQGRLTFETTASGGSTPTERLRIDSSGHFTVANGSDFIFSTSTGTKIGTATTQKIGFYNATPVVQPAAVADATDASSAITQLNLALARLRTLGLIAT